MIKNELTVVQGFGALNKVFDVTANEVISYGQIFTVANGAATAVTALDDAPLYIAQNTTSNTDSAYMANSFNLVSKVTGYPLTAPIEIEIPAALNDGIAVDGTDLGVAVYNDSEGKYTKTVGANATKVGTVSGVSEDGLVTIFVG